MGTWCHACGQRSGHHRRSLFHLVNEALEGLFHLDSRLWRTLPGLFFRPGRLAQDYMQGRVARHIPPLRLYFVTLLIFIFAAEFSIHQRHQAVAAPAGQSMSAGQVGATGLHLGDGAVQIHVSDAGEGSWFSEKLKKALGNTDYFLTLVFSWAHRLAILLLPVMASILGFLYFYKRQFMFYDHIIISMNYLSFIFICLSIYLFSALILPVSVSSITNFAWGIFIPFNLILTLRGAYASGMVGAVVKSGIILVSLFAVLGLSVVGLLMVGLAQI